MIFSGSVFDFFDGLVARALKVNNPIGKDLDSLADVITFGLAPAMLLFNFMSGVYIKYVSFLLVAFAALRLARFNNDPEQKFIFKGLPTPAMALFFISLVLAVEMQGYMFLKNDFLIAGAVILLSFFMVSNVPMMSFKFRTLADLYKDKVRMVFLFLSLLLIVLFGWLGLTASLLLYLLFSVLFVRTEK